MNLHVSVVHNNRKAQILFFRRNWSGKLDLHTWLVRVES